MITAAIEHHPVDQCFILEWQGQQARLEYHVRAATATTPGLVDFSHTYVPPEFRGQGLAEQLVQVGLRWAAQQNVQVQASCWYVAKVMRANAAAAVSDPADSGHHNSKG